MGWGTKQRGRGEFASWTLLIDVFSVREDEGGSTDEEKGRREGVIDDAHRQISCHTERRCFSASRSTCKVKRARGSASKRHLYWRGGVTPT